MVIDLAKKQNSGFQALLNRLNDEQRELLDESPRQNRLLLLAQFLRMTELETVKKLGEVCDIPAKVKFELVEGASGIIPLRLIHEYQCLPFEVESSAEKEEAESYIHLITLWPPDAAMNAWIYAVCGRWPKWHFGLAKAISNCITQNFGVGSDSLSDSDFDDLLADADIEDVEDEDAALIRFVNEVIQKAVEDRATDIHFEPQKDSLQIRYRIDGELVPIRVPDNLIRFQDAIISRLKIMAKLNISEKRRPQDGRINYKSGSDELDIRISTMPTMYGESISLRLLNQKNQPLSFSELGLEESELVQIERVLQMPHGIILVTGPTGHGKSTSLTAFVREINTPGRRIITVEDPIEYEVPGVNQMQVHTEIGFTFANALRHILRQDPDIIMVGEIRDPETSDIAIRAALTGHLVLSTIHTNDAPGALTRLIDMEIEPFLIASAVELIIAQRLVRRLCSNCRQPVKMDRLEMQECLRALGVPVTEENLNATVYEPLGCERCRNLGFRGRIGIFEILRVDDVIHEMIIRKNTARQIREVAVRRGMSTLQLSAWNHVRQGKTSLAEIMRFSKISEEPEVV